MRLLRVKLPCSYIPYKVTSTNYDAGSFTRGRKFLPFHSSFIFPSILFLPLDFVSFSIAVFSFYENFKRDSVNNTSRCKVWIVEIPSLIVADNTKVTNLRFYLICLNTFKKIEECLAKWSELSLTYQKGSLPSLRIEETAVWCGRCVVTSGKTPAVRVANRMSRNENSFAARLSCSYRGGDALLSDRRTIAIWD